MARVSRKPKTKKRSTSSGAKKGKRTKAALGSKKGSPATTKSGRVRSPLNAQAKDPISPLVEKFARTLKARGMKMVAAESCTGGWLAKCVTDLAGSSDWFDRGYVTYSNQAKVDALGVEESTLARFGAVSEETVREMAEGALTHSQAQVSVAISGIAGPSGGSDEKPVGTVCFGITVEKSETELFTFTCTQHFKGSRDGVRSESVLFALQWLLDVVTEFRQND